MEFLTQVLWLLLGAAAGTLAGRAIFSKGKGISRTQQAEIDQQKKQLQDLA
jgi:hypothetical protein